MAIAACDGCTTWPMSQLGRQDNISSEIITFYAAWLQPALMSHVQQRAGGSASAFLPNTL